MVLRQGTIYDQAPSPNNLVNQQVHAYGRYVGTVIAFDRSTGIASVRVGEATISVHISNLRQIWIVTADKVNDLPCGPDGQTRRLLKLDQWEYALENFVMTGADEVQFGWWKDRESDTETYFQLPLAGVVNRYDPDFVEIVRMARRKNLFGDYLFDDPYELVEEYFTKIKPKKEKKKKR